MYQAEVHGDNKVMKYFGSTVDFKARYSQHYSSFKNRPANHTTLSSYVWKLKDKNAHYEIKWDIKARGHSFSSGSKTFDSCRHKRGHLLVSVKQTPIDNG